MWTGRRKTISTAATRARGLRSYCHPDVYHGEPPTLYHNNGDGTFTDVSKRPVWEASRATAWESSPLIMTMMAGRTFSSPTITCRIFCFTTIVTAHFERSDTLAGVAVSVDGQFEAGMGTDAADTTGNGRHGLVVTHLDHNSRACIRTLANGVLRRCDLPFQDFLCHVSSLADSVRAFWITTMMAARDLFMANGHVLDNIQRYHAETTYAEPKLMFRNTGRGFLENVSDRLGADFLLPRVSRGVAVGDFDNDGDLDILVSNNGSVRNFCATMAATPTTGSRFFSSARVRIATLSAPA